MPNLKDRMIFISHAWQHSEHYWTIVKWFNDEPNFAWRNCSVPSHDSLPNKTSKGLSDGMSKQIRPSQVVVILAGMYASHSSWIDYEIKEAQRMGKSIVGVRPWNQQRVPQNVQDASSVPIVGWNSSSIVTAVRNLS